MFVVGVAAFALVHLVATWLIAVAVAVVAGAAKALVVGVAVALPAVLF